MTETTNKTDAFEYIYNNLTSVQEMYRKMISHFSRQLWEIDEIDSKNKEKISLKNMFNKNIDLANDSLYRLEKIKYFSSIAILTEGSQISEEQLSDIIVDIDHLLNISELESKVPDKDLVDWVDEKIQYFKSTRNVFLQILGHKVKSKNKRGLVIYQ